MKWFVRVEIAVGVVEASSGESVNMNDGQASERIEEENEARQETEQDSMLASNSQSRQSRPKELETRRSGKADQLLELVASDERGDTHMARQRVPVETFEIAVPIRVFGAVGAAGADGFKAASAGEDGEGEGLLI